MKSNNAHLAFFFFFVAAAATALCAFTTAEYVYDSDGHPLKNGGKYYFSPAAPIGGPFIKGARLEKESDDGCWLAVVAKLYEHAWATKIASPLDEYYITTDSPLWISFDRLPPNPCTNHSQWLVISVKGFGYPVMVGDPKEYLTDHVSGWFYLRPYDSAKHEYKLVFCFEHYKCENVGDKIDSHDNSRLIVTEKEPLVFKFDKAKTSHISMVI